MEFDYPTAARPIVGHPLPVKVNLVEIGLVSDRELLDLMRLSMRMCRQVVLDAPPPESTMESPGAPLTYRIASGDEIANQIPHIYRLYAEQLPQLVKQYTGISIVPSKYRQSAVTLNLLSQGERYEMHVDSNSVTGLLYANSLSKADGGALRLYYPGNRGPVEIQPVAGDFLIYDARWVPHEVSTVLTAKGRLSLPMNYFLETDIESRPERIDRYLFGNVEVPKSDTDGTATESS